MTPSPSPPPPPLKDRGPCLPPGEGRFIAALRRWVMPPLPGEMPKPGSTWEAWAEYRLKRLEDQQLWMMRLILGALVMQVGLQVLQMLH